FRQIKVSTIKDFSSVMHVTVSRDAGQYSFERSYQALCRCFSHHWHDVDCIIRETCTKSFIPRLFQSHPDLQATWQTFFLLRSSAEIGDAFFRTCSSGCD